jgi:predicted acylesterase/phospholipase RssA
MLDYKYLVLSGGGVNGFLHIGALIFLERYLYSEHKTTIREHFMGFAGVSIGSFIALCILCDMSTTEIVRLSQEHMPELLSFEISLFSLVQNNALRDNDSLKKCIQQIFVLKTKKLDMTFRELYEFYPTEFTVTASNIYTHSVTHFNRSDTPTVSVTQAILASMAIPFVFPPVCINDSLFIDGGFLLNLPMSIYPVEHTLAFWIREIPDETRVKKTNLSSITKQIIKTFYLAPDVITAECYKTQRRHIVQLSTMNNSILLVPIKNITFPIHRGFLLTGHHVLQHCLLSSATLFWLITEYSYLFIVRKFIAWGLSHLLLHALVATDRSTAL